ncbi:TMV resistance protein N-like [Eucalyptus grandis]|uniref:TMV resistance protein N-like n=1 Tax=Eucalyptus grandis TaxID=71139 RepID=UPI00192EF8A4|nr:TMV resistance protein N-like [Eucalyptus grandis]
MDRLKVLDLTGCIQLRRTPDFSIFMTLEILILARCVKLTTIDHSIGKLEHLTTLNIKGCRCLQELPAEFGSLQSLENIIMPQNFQPFKLPETLGKLESLSSLILDEHPEISKLPDSIGQLVKLTHLSLCGCVKIKELPCSIGQLQMLAKLDLSKSGVVELPDCIGKLKKLRVMRISFTKIRKFPLTIGQVEMLEELSAKKCWDLIEENLEEIGKLFHLRILDLSYTKVSRFPTVLGCLSSLQKLELGSSCLLEVPDLPSNLTHLHMQAGQFPFIPDLSSLVSLEYLELSKLTDSTGAPGPIWTVNSPVKQPIHPLPFGLTTLKFSGITEMPPLSNLKNLSILWVIDYPLPDFSISQDIKYLKELKLSKCKRLKKIYGLSLLKNLERLYLSSLEKLVEIQDLAELQSLWYLRISHCNKIEMLPNLSKLDKLQHIELDACEKITVIEGVEGLKSWELNHRGCTVLERMWEVSTPTWLSRNIPVYDVFLSFQGPDTHYSIVDYLYKNLVRNRISVFMDNHEFSSGDGISRELELALSDSYIYIPFLSKNYASSHWCLYELVHMVESTSQSNGKKRILPIFYDVEIDDVKLKSKLYRRQLEEQKWWYGDKVKEWENALKKVADMKGFDLKSNSLEEVIELVTEEVLREVESANIRRPQAGED